jgi:hypothetical protein
LMKILCRCERYKRSLILQEIIAGHHHRLPNSLG